MFLNREKEIELLEELYSSKKFEFLVLYGRRRIGKTALLQEFTKKHKAIFFSAQEKSDLLNLRDFSKSVQSYFENDFISPFETWENSIDYICKKTEDEKFKNERIFIVIDEFPFIAQENPSIKSIFQHTIDLKWKEKNIFLILCGSSVRFMENEIMGYKSPLYGRATSILHLKKFDYFESAKFFPNYSNLDKLIAYGILGGIPCYLETFDDTKSIEENIAKKILKTSTFLKEEPIFLLKQELREPAIYNSIFEAIANGSSRLNDISSKIKEESQKCSKYLSVLQTLKLVTKSVPCGENENSKRTVYKISDNYFLFWYHFLFEKKSFYEILGEEDAAKEICIPQNLNTHLGRIFEEICLEYMIRLAKNRKLPFIPSNFGKWWGNNPQRKMQDDIDVLLIDSKNEKFIFCECKFKNEPFDKEEYESMMSRKSIFPYAKESYFYAFSKSGFTEWVIEQSKKDGTVLVGVEDLFEM